MQVVANNDWFRAGDRNYGPVALRISLLDATVLEIIDIEVARSIHDPQTVDGATQTRRSAAGAKEGRPLQQPPKSLERTGPDRPHDFPGRSLVTFSGILHLKGHTLFHGPRIGIRP